MKYCQGPKCHEYKTKDRIRGSKGDKHYETRRRTHLNYGNEWCSMQCYNDWAEIFIDRAIDHFGRLTEPKHLNENNAWEKDYDWRNTTDDEHRYYVVNGITKEERPITREQYNDDNYTLNTS